MVVTASAPATNSHPLKNLRSLLCQGHGIAMSNFRTQDLGLQDNEKGQAKGYLMARVESLAFLREHISDRPYFLFVETNKKGARRRWTSCNAMGKA